MAGLPCPASVAALALALGIGGCSAPEPSRPQPAFYADLARPGAVLDPVTASEIINAYRAQGGLPRSAGTSGSSASRRAKRGGWPSAAISRMVVARVSGRADSGGLCAAGGQAQRYRRVITALPTRFRAGVGAGA